MDTKIKKSIIWGIGGGLALLLLYFLILTLANSFSHALEQFQLLWYWILALVIGFSIQVGLYSYIRNQIREREVKTASKEVAVSGGVSTGSMVACCAHHLVDVLPILGLSAAFLFLVQYQVFFILLGILSNIVGIILMLEIIKRHSLYQENGILYKIAQFNIKKLKSGVLVASVLILAISFFWIKINNKPNYAVASKSSVKNSESVVITPEIISWPSKTNDAGGLAIEVQPINFFFNEPIQFNISLNTHQGNLDFDLTKKAVLIDEQNNQYQPLEWQGGQGGHHLSGTLIFPTVKETASLRLIIRDVYGVKEREFLWIFN